MSTWLHCGWRWETKKPQCSINTQNASWVSPQYKLIIFHTNYVLATQQLPKLCENMSKPHARFTMSWCLWICYLLGVPFDTNYFLHIYQDAVLLFFTFIKITIFPPIQWKCWKDGGWVNSTVLIELLGSFRIICTYIVKIPSELFDFCNL